MHIERLDHVNIETDDLAATRDFYVTAIGLRVGERPPFPFAGYWLYDDRFPVIHLIERAAGEERSIDTGAINHIAFRAAGLAAMRERLRACNISASERIVPRNGELQMFITDPNGVAIELGFAASEVFASGERSEPLNRS